MITRINTLPISFQGKTNSNSDPESKNNQGLNNNYQQSSEYISSKASRCYAAQASASIKFGAPPFSKEEMEKMVEKNITVTGKRKAQADTLRRKLKDALILLRGPQALPNDPTKQFIQYFPNPNITIMTKGEKIKLEQGILYIPSSFIKDKTPQEIKKELEKSPYSLGDTISKKTPQEAEGSKKRPGDSKLLELQGKVRKKQKEDQENLDEIIENISSL